MADGSLQVCALTDFLADSRACEHANLQHDEAPSAVLGLQGLLRQKELELEERGRLLLKSKVWLSTAARTVGRVMCYNTFHWV